MEINTIYFIRKKESMLKYFYYILFILPLAISSQTVDCSSSLKTIDKKFLVVAQTPASNPDEIICTLAKMIGDVPEGHANKIRVSAYGYDLNPFFNALVTASASGKNMRIVFNPKLKKDTGVIAFANRILDSKEDVKFGKIGKLNNHNKFILFANVKFPNENFYRSNVIAQTSCNFISTRRSNDLILIEDEAIYKAYYEYWLELKEDDERYYEKTVTSKDGKIKCHFYPRTKDNIAEILSNIKGNKETKIYILQSEFTGIRSKAIVRKIKDLARQGCEIKIIATKYEKKEDDQYSRGNLWSLIEKRLRKIKGVELKTYKEKVANNHSKILMIDAQNYEGSPQKVVCTGSHNFSRNSLYNNSEVLLEIKNSGVFEEYEKYFLSLWKRVDDFE